MLNMQLTQASQSDKEKVFEFCKKTFSWGDYIQDVWDYWISEGNLLVVRENNIPVAISHSSISKSGNQVWIEGIRVDPKFRRKGFAKQMVLEAEKIAKQNNCNVSYMLIETNNTKSLQLARVLNYENKETWNLYSLLPNKLDSKPNIEFANYEKKKPKALFSSLHFYVKSWRWLPLDESTIQSLSKENRILFTEHNGNTESLAIFTESEHFDKTLILTIISGSESGLTKILAYIQNLAFQKNYKRIQILTTHSLPKYEGLERRLSFYLMKKQI